MNTITRNRVVVTATRAPGSLERELPPHDTGWIIARSTGAVWLRFGIKGMGQAAPDASSILFTGEERIFMVPPGATHFRVLAQYFPVPVQLESFVQAPPGPEPPEPTPEPEDFTYLPNQFNGTPIVPGGAGWAAHTDACFGRDEASGGLAKAWKSIAVTNLKLSGAGSAKAAFEATGPRLVTFWVSGIIDYSNADDDDRQIIITDGDLYIAGESAPAPGIVIFGAQIVIDMDTAKNSVLSHFANFQSFYDDVVKQDSRGEPMSHRVKDGDSPTNSNIVHSSMLYGYTNDEAADANYGAHNIDYYQSILGPGIYSEHNDSGIPHAYGPLISRVRVESRGMFARCAFLHNKERNPLTRAPLLTVANCLTFDCWNRCVELQSWEGVKTQTNIEGNIFVDGPMGKNDVVFRQTSGNGLYSDASTFYMGGNRALGYDDSSQAKLVSSGNGTMVDARIAAAFPPGLVITPINDQREEMARLIARHAGPWPAMRQPVVAQYLAHVEARLSGQGDQGGAVTEPDMPTLAQNSCDHTKGDDPMPGITSDDDQMVGEAGRELMPSGVTAVEEWLDRKRGKIMPADAVRIEDASAYAHMRERPHVKWREKYARRQR